LFLVLLPLSAKAEPLKILAYGDSLTAGYGLEKKDSFPMQLENALIEAGHDISIINAGISGDTTSGGLSRLNWTLNEHNPDIIILELGANDALRGVMPRVASQNLDEIIRLLQNNNIQILLTGMKAPRNWGQKYVDEFDRIYPDLSKKYNILLYPFFLKDVATDTQLNQNDAMHPNKEGISVIVKNITPYIIELIEKHKKEGDIK